MLTDSITVWLKDGTQIVLSADFSSLLEAAEQLGHLGDIDKTQIEKLIIELYAGDNISWERE